MQLQKIHLISTYQFGTEGTHQRENRNLNRGNTPTSYACHHNLCLYKYMSAFLLCVGPTQDALRYVL